MGKALCRGDRLTVSILDVALGGDGVARNGEMVLFVPLTVDGDEVEVEVTVLKKRFARGEAVRIIDPSGHRVKAPCPWYGVCGGCRMQHIEYDHQLGLKKRQVEEAFIRIGKFPHPPVAPVIPSPQPYAYRGKAEFHLSAGKGAAPRIGLMARESNDLVEVEHCLILDETINQKYGRFREALGRGAVDVRPESQSIWSDLPGEAPIAIASGPQRPPDVLRVVKGKRMLVPYEGFFQANVFLIEELVNAVIAMSSLTGQGTLADAYGGSGLFSLFLGPLSRRLYVIEGDREAARCAGINLQNAGIDHATVFQGDVGQIVQKKLVAGRQKVDTVILDPPRAGCGEPVLAGVVALKPDKIVYVSCNPATQARDCKVFAESGYSLRTLQPLDMFPQTAHVEVVALLTPS